MAMKSKISYEDWWSEGVRRFGENTEDWEFVCPVCGTISAIKDFRAFKDQGATPTSATCECIGRYAGATDAFDAVKHKPCNYAGYGLFRLSPITVVFGDGKESDCFAFAETTEVQP